MASFFLVTFCYREVEPLSLLCALVVRKVSEHQHGGFIKIGINLRVVDNHFG